MKTSAGGERVGVPAGYTPPPGQPVGVPSLSLSLPPCPPFSLSKYYRPLVSFFASFQFSPVRYSPGTSTLRRQRAHTGRPPREKKSKRRFLREDEDKGETSLIR